MLLSLIKPVFVWTYMVLATQVTADYPKREIAGISVVDTDIVRSAEDFAKQHSSNAIYKHVMRSWLYGVLFINSDETLSNSIDLEIHAVSALLHDLGWDKNGNSSVVSPDKRFEVDGAIAARDFIESRGNTQDWSERRLQLVWDAIALHTERSIAYFKELDVQVVSKGITMDFAGPLFNVSEEQYAEVGRVFPKDDLVDAVNGTFLWLCETKPATTYDTWMQPWGDLYVDGYNATGKRRVDLIFTNLTMANNGALDAGGV